MFEISEQVKIKKKYSKIGIEETKKRKSNGKRFCGEEDYWDKVKLNTNKIYKIIDIDKDGDIILNCNDGLEFYKEQLEWLGKQVNL